MASPEAAWLTTSGLLSTMSYLWNGRSAVIGGGDSGGGTGVSASIHDYLPESTLTS